MQKNLFIIGIIFIAISLFLGYLKKDVENIHMKNGTKKLIVESKTYTQEEVDAMIAFYGTPIGQSVLRKQGEFAKTYMPSLISMIDKHNQQAFQRLWPDLQREIEVIMRPNRPDSDKRR